MKLLAIIFFVGLFQQAFLTSSQVDSSLWMVLKAKGTTNVFVTLKDKTSDTLNLVARHLFQTRAERLNAVTNALKAFAARSQVSALNLLKQEAREKQLTFESMWISNQIFIRDADLDLIEKLSALDEIESIAEEKIFPLEEPINFKVYENLPATREDEFQWGVEKIEAPQVWSGGNDGKGVVVATIDTGARGTHETLVKNHRKSYGWFDPKFYTPEANDNNGHGTHTTATIAGTLRGVGVAPGAQWIACKGCEYTLCFQSALTACGQFIACPTDTDGNNPDCSQAPDIVSNSWGGSRGNEWYRPITDAWEVGGIIPLFSIGNYGPSCDTANSPGDYDNVIGVGSTTVDNFISNFSSVGPTLINQNMKPDISAPGSNVFSAYYNSDTAYAIMSGTSMACPHAAGTVALMLASIPGADRKYEMVKKALETGSVPTTSEGKVCSGIPDTKIPNHHTGHGRINARQSVARYVQLIEGLIAT